MFLVVAYGYMASGLIGLAYSRLHRRTHEAASGTVEAQQAGEAGSEK
jgi:hypothetical protein